MPNTETFSSIIPTVVSPVETTRHDDGRNGMTTIRVYDADSGRHVSIMLFPADAASLAADLTASILNVRN
jgi:hypothetical protein